MQHLEEGTIHAWIDGALSPAESRDVEAHLATCAACSELAAEARGLVAASSRILTALDDVPADVIPIATPASVEAPTNVRPIRSDAKRRWATPIWMRTAAAVLVVAGASALVWTAKLNSPETKSAMLSMDTSVVDMAEETMASAMPDSTTLAIAPSGTDAVSAPMAPPANLPQVAARSSVVGKGTTASPRPVATATGNAALSADGRTTLSGAVGAAAGQATAGLPGSRTEQNVTSSLDRQLAQQTIADREDRLRRGSASEATAERRAADLASRREAASVLATRPASPTLHADTGAVSPPSPLGTLRSTLGKARQSSAAAAAPAAVRGFSLPPALLTARGCYELTLSPWSGGSIPFGAPPPKIELDTIRSDAGDLLVHPGRGAASNGAPHAFWTQQGDSVYVTWENDTRGVRLALPATGSVLRGRAETIAHGIAGVEPQRSDVVARRISCRE